MEDNLTDEEIYNDVVRPTSSLSLLSEELPSLSSPALVKTHTRLKSTPIDYSCRLADPHLNLPCVRDQSSHAMDQVVAEFVMAQAEAKIALEQASEARRRLSEQREALTRLAQQVIAEDAREATAQLDRFCDSIYSLQSEIRSQNTQAVRLLNSRDTSEAAISAAKQRAERTLAQLRQELIRCPSVNIGTEIFSQDRRPQQSAEAEDLKREISMLKAEQKRLVGADLMLASNVERLTEAIVDRSRGYEESWQALRLDESNLHSVGSLMRLKEGVEAAFAAFDEKLRARDELLERTLTSYKQSTGHEFRALQLKSEEEVALAKEQTRAEERQVARTEILQLREANRKLSETVAAQNSQLSEMREKYSQLAADIDSLQAEASQALQSRDAELRELKTALQENRHAHEAERLQLQTRTEDEVSALQEANSALSSEVARLKQDLLDERKRLGDAKQALGASLEGEYERKIEQLQRAHREESEALRESTASQLAALQQKLDAAEEAKSELVAEAKAAVSQQEEALRARLRSQLQALHKRELDFLCRDVEDFVQRLRSELTHLAGTVEDALKYPSERAVLRGVWADLSSLARRIEFKVNRRDAEPEGAWKHPAPPCKRCGNRVNEETCRFHPFLAGATEFSEWRRCRDAKHSTSDPPCCTALSHAHNGEVSSISQVQSTDKSLSRLAKRWKASPSEERSPYPEKSHRSESQRSLLGTTRVRLEGSLGKPPATLRRTEVLSDSALSSSEQLAQYLSRG